MAALIVLVTVGLVAVGMGLRTSAHAPAPSAKDRGSLSAPSTPTPRPPAAAPAPPVLLEVPSVGIETRVVQVGLNPDNTLEVPSEPSQAGWYTGSPEPGGRGPAIIAGHVDSTDGPAVFYRLGQVERGDRIAVTSSSGESADFEVVAVRSYRQDDFPTETVYGNTDGATLRLITCGDWNEETADYDGNVVVFAKLAPSGP